MRSKVLAPLKKGKMGFFYFILVGIKSKCFFLYSFLFLSLCLMDNDLFANQILFHLEICYTIWEKWLVKAGLC